MKPIETVSIALQPSVYNTFRALNNTVAMTLGEYVDNSVQSYINNKEQLINNDPTYSFIVSIEINNTYDTISIKDNAAGIDFKNYIRAFEPANIPLDNTKLNEFGMGMKTASVWLADIWSVRTKALGENVERYTEFNIQKVISDNKEDLRVIETEKEKNLHYTEIVLSKLSHNAPSTHQVDKIKRHLSSIYRKFIRGKEITIKVNGETLKSPEFEILEERYHNDATGEKILWKKEIDFSLGHYKAKGFIAILKTIQNNANGLVLLRRGRVIVGGEEDRYFPYSIFGSPGNFIYKRLFGELELEGFEVTFNKNKFVAEENLVDFLEALKAELKDPNFNLLSQAQNFRVNKTKEVNSEIAQKIAQSNKKNSNQFNNKIINDENFTPETIVEEEKINISNITPLQTLDHGSFEYCNETYKFQIDLINEEHINSLYTVNQAFNIKDDKKYPVLICKINLAHPFFNRFEQFKKANDYEPIMAIFKSFALAEFISTKKSIQYPSEMRTYFNEYIVED